MPAHRTSVVLITHEHRFAAHVMTRGQRFLDMLNDRTSEYLHIHNVEVFRRIDSEICIAAFPEAIVRKEDLHLAIVTGERHEAPEQRLFGFIHKNRYHVFLTVPGYEVHGSLHLTHSPDLLAVLARDTGTFFPVTQATVSSATAPGDPMTVPVIMVNKGSVALFHLGEAPVQT